MDCRFLASLPGHLLLLSMAIRLALAARDCRAPAQDHIHMNIVNVIALCGRNINRIPSGHCLSALLVVPIWKLPDVEWIECVETLSLWRDVDFETVFLQITLGWLQEGHQKTLWLFVFL